MEERPRAAANFELRKDKETGSEDSLAGETSHHQSGASTATAQGSDPQTKGAKGLRVKSASNESPSLDPDDGGEAQVAAFAMAAQRADAGGRPGLVGASRVRRRKESLGE